jgi:ATP/maltotriose-dependent transcriptional regulator MalT
LEGNSRSYLAEILLRMGETEAAEAQVRRAVELLDATKPGQLLARATLANVLLAEGRPAEALAEAREARALVATMSMIDEGRALANLVYAEALQASGEDALARAAIAEARDKILAMAARIVDPDRRRGFIEDVPENMRTMDLARRWLGEHAGPDAAPAG